MEAQSAGYEHSKWKGTTGGTPWMQRSLVHILGAIDQRVVYAFLWIIIPFYMLFAHKAYLAQYCFFRQRFNQGIMLSFWHVFMNNITFGKIIVDRFASYGGRKFKFELDGYDIWKETDSESDGFMQVSSHIGNYELAGYSLRSENKPFNALVFFGETETVMNNRNKSFTPNNIRMIPVSGDMSHIFTLNNALSLGEIVSMPGDRMFGSQKYIIHRFLGADAKFPMGPYSLATARQCKMLAVFVMKKDYQTYYIRVRRLSDGGAVKKADQIRNLSASFVSELESIVREYPTQWFNYYDFWSMS